MIICLKFILVFLIFSLIAESPKETKKVSNKTHVKSSKIQKPHFVYQLKRQYIDQELANLPKVLGQAKARFISSTSTKKTDGVKMEKIKKSSIFQKVGLQKGDVIKSFNGETIDTAQKAMEIYQALKSSEDIHLQIERQGLQKLILIKIEN